MKTKRPTLRDVAREADVSYQTVSRVINNDPHVAAATRKRVMKAIDALDFRPNHAAQVLQTKRSHTLEIVIPYDGFNRVLFSLARTTNQMGYRFLITAVNPEDYAETLASARSNSIDGLILIPIISMIDSYDELITLTGGTPFVQLGAAMGAPLPSVIYDQHQGGRLATQHLIDLGHREIVEISGRLQSYDGLGRHESFVATLKESGIEPVACVEGDFNLESGYEAMKQLLDTGTRFTAAFVANDSMAFGAHTALRERGLRVPEDVSLVGFDDIPESAHFVPALTTVYQDFDTMGRMAVEYLVDLITNPLATPHQRVLIPKLVVRGSTRAL